MEKIEIYSGKRKSFLLLIGSLLFVIGGIYIIMNSANPSGFSSHSPLFLKAIGIVSILFFGLGIYVSIKQLLGNQLVLIIDKKGININPKKSLTDYIEWENINGFSTIKIQSQKIVIIEVNNSDFWIENEENGIRKSLMKFNLNKYGSPFNLSANSTELNYKELMKTLCENLNKYKYNT